MYSPLSNNFKRAIKESGRRKTVVDVYYNGSIVTSNLPVSEGSIRVDLEGQVRRSGNVVVADPGLVNTFSTAISPLGTEFLIRQGVVYNDGSEELIPLGMFRVEVAGWRDGENIPSIQLYDRSKALQVSLPDSLSRSGVMAQKVITDFIEYFYPGSTSASMWTGIPNWRLPGGHVFDQSTYWDAIQALAANMGARVYFDVTGAPRATMIPDLSSAVTPDFELFVGEGGILVSADREFSREGVFNAVTVTGAAGPNGKIPVFTAINNNAGSPLRWGGPFGKVRDEINDSSIVDQGQAVARARAELSKYRGLSYSLDFSAIPNPAVEVGDIGRFRFSTGEFQIHEISTLSIPLGKGDFTGTSKGGFVNG